MSEIYFVEHRMFICITFVKYKSLKKCCRYFVRKCPMLEICKRAVEKLSVTGSVLDKKQNAPRCMICINSECKLPI